MNNLPKPSSGRYDAFAPKFKYVRDFSGMTRKTTRVKKDDILQIGSVVRVDSKPQRNNLYPWTKPMIGWKRVYVGQGDWRKRGRRKRTIKKIEPIIGAFKAIKKPFVKQPSTYLHKELKRKYK